MGTHTELFRHALVSPLAAYRISFFFHFFFVHSIKWKTTVCPKCHWLLYPTFISKKRHSKWSKSPFCGRWGWEGEEGMGKCFGLRCWHGALFSLIVLSIQGYERANLLTHAQVELIKAIDKQSPEQVQAAVQEKGTAYASLILHLLQNLSRPDTVQYVCVLTDTILSGKDPWWWWWFHKKKTHIDPCPSIGSDDNAKYFQQVASEGEGYPYGPFFK